MGSLVSAGWVSSYGDIVRMQCEETGEGPIIFYKARYCSSYDGFGINIVVKDFCPLSVKHNVKTHTCSK